LTEGVFMSAVLLVMLGGTIGFFTAALCKVAGKADRNIEILEAQENNIDDFVISEIKSSTDLVNDSIELEKKTLI